jgi:tight adherence protein C
MLSQKSLFIFYSICGVIVVWMLFRIWRKNRSSNTSKTASTQSARQTAVPPVPPTTAPAASTAPKTASSAAASVSTSSQALSTKQESVQPANASAPEVAPVPQAIRATYAPTAVLRTDTGGTNLTSWENRRLLDTQGMAPRSTNTMPRVLPEEVPGVDDSDRTFGSGLNPAFASLLPDSDERREEARKDLMAAGYYNPHAVENLAATRYVLMMLGMVTFGALLLIVPPRLEPWMVSGCILAPLLGWAVPALYIRNKARERRHQIERAMPDLLDMLNMCVSQGLTVPDSLLRIGRDFRPVYPELSQELLIVNEQSSTRHVQRYHARKSAAAGR